MPYKNIVFAKLEKRLFNDPRWYMMSEPAQLNYIRLILFAAETYNKIPKNLTALRKGFKTDQDENTIEATLSEIKVNFKKFKENRYYYYFEEFEEKTNYIPTKEIPGKAQGKPKEATEEEEDKEKDKEEDKEKDKEKEGLRESTKAIVSDLNNVLGTQYKHSSLKTKESISARLKEGFTVDDFKAVHRKMLRAWGASTKMAQFLRPATLYSSKFEGYLNLKEPTTKLTKAGIRAYVVGQEWLKKEGADG